jgi:predicted RNA-binding Zn ribbon-like protein
MTVSTNIPPHGLELVIDFVNTLNVETGEDRMGTPAHLARWLRDRGLCGGDAPAPRESDLQEALELRKGLRAVLHAHTRGEHDRAAGDALERVAQLGQLSVRFDPGGSVDIAPRATGYPGVLARLLVPAAYAALDGTWQRVKACDADDCLEAFYDQSRNRSGRWCDMAVCGNRTKVRAYRSKRAG